MKPIKRPFKLSVLGMFRLETENMSLKEILIILAVVMGFVIAIIILLKSYALPTLGVSGIRSTVKLFRPRAP
jgi:hypothetical protein